MLTPDYFFLHFYFLYLLLLVLHLCLRCGSLFYLLPRFLFCLSMPFPPFRLIFLTYFSSPPSPLAVFCFSHPPSHSSNPFFPSLSFSWSRPHHTFPLLPSLIIFSFSWIYPHLVTFSHPLSVICVSFFLYHLPSPSFPLSVFFSVFFLVAS